MKVTINYRKNVKFRILIAAVLISLFSAIGNVRAESYFETLFGSIFQTAQAEKPSSEDNLLSFVQWTGGSVLNSNWSSNSNWQLGNVPGSDDVLVFPADAARKTNVNDFPAGTIIHSMQITDGYSITGNSIFLRTEILTGGNVNFSPNITLASPNLPKLIHVNNGSLNLNGTFNLNGDSLTIEGNNNLFFNNTIIGGTTNRITKNGTGTTIINSTASEVSGISLNEGSVEANGTLGSIDLLGGTLRGNGRVGIVRGNLSASEGAIAPGSGGTTTATLTSTGDVDFSSVIDLEINLNGTTVSSQYDRLVSNGGDISLSNANLVVALGFTPTVGQTFTIVQTTNGAGNTIFGQFAQDNEIVVNGQIFSITYESQRVFLTAQGALPTLLTWDGGGTTNNWSDAANWNPNFVPRDGMDLVFPAGAARKTNTNDLTDLDVDNITFNDSGYNISGNAINLHNGFTSNSSSSSSQFRVQINLLSQNQTFLVSGGTGITFGAISLGGHTLTLDNNSGSFLTLDDVISGTGGIIKQGASAATFNAHNTYLGVTQINAGSIKIGHRFALGIVGSGNHTVVNQNAALEISNNITSVQEAITLNNGNLLGDSCPSGCSIESQITLNGNNTISSKFAGETFTLVGAITGMGGFTTNFNGTLKLTGNNAYSGNTNLTGEGRLLINGTQTNSNISLSGGTLGGNGLMLSVSTASGGGIISPGDNNAASMQANNFNLTSNSTYQVDIHAQAPAGQPKNDRISNASGAINLGGANLTGTIISTPTVGQQFTIVNSPQITGQFAQGNNVTIGGRRFSITYNPTSVILTALASTKSPADFDGDGKTDISIYRPAPGEWWYRRSSDGQVPAAQFGLSTDKITPGDFTGDGKADIAFWRSSTGEWFILRSQDGSFFSFPFGQNGDVPAPADYDADGKTDVAVFRPSTGTWFILLSSDGNTTIVNFGANGDKPVTADYDGDGKSDIAIFRPADGSWWYLRSSDGQFRVYNFGVSTDKPVQGDFTGDGKADIAVFRPSTGEWFIQRSEDNSFFSFPFGTSGDIPTPGDYDGDGKFDAAVFRPSNANWFVQNSNGSGTSIIGFGANGDIPIPTALIP